MLAKLSHLHGFLPMLLAFCKIAGVILLIKGGCWCIKFNRRLNKGGRL